MNGLVLKAVLIGNLIITSYRATKEQTDSTPFNTSTGEHVRAGGCAVSRDLLCGACRKLHHRCDHPEVGTKIHYGEWLYIKKYGFRQVNDVMGEYTTVRRHGKRVHMPITQHVDIFVDKWREEHAIGTRRLEVFEVKEERQ